MRGDVERRSQMRQPLPRERFSPSTHSGHFRYGRVARSLTTLDGGFHDIADINMNPKPVGNPMEYLR